MSRRMPSLLLEAINRRFIAKRTKRRHKKRNLKKKYYYTGWSSLPSFQLEAIHRRIVAKRRRTRHKKREPGNEYYADWSNLPQDILGMIADKMTLIDCLSISKVCKSWNVVLGEEVPCRQGHGFPWLLMSGQQNKEVRTCISIFENRVWELELPEAQGKYCWGSFRDWLIMVKDLDSFNLEINLLNLFSRKQIALPSIWNFFHKMVLSGLPSDENFVCMLLHSQYQELAFWIPGAQSWYKHKLAGKPFQDAVFFNGSFYLLGDGFDVWQIDVKNIYSSISNDEYDIGILIDLEIQFHEVNRPEILQLQEGMILQNDDGFQILRYLVESRGEILLICRYFSATQDVLLETQNFEVYSLDVFELSWKKVENLGDQIIFLGKCCSTSFSAKEIGIGIRNNIYFSNDQPSPWWNEWDSDFLKSIRARLGFNKTEGRDWGIFKLGSDDRKPFCFHGDIDNWTYTWFTAPAWWCFRNIPMIERK